MFVHQAAGVGLGCSVPAADILPVGQRAARSLSERWPALSLAGGKHGTYWAQGHQLALESPVAAPSNREQKWTPRPCTSSFCSRPCRSSAQPSPGLWITLSSARSSPRLLRSPFSAPQHQGPGADMDREEKKDMVCWSLSLSASQKGSPACQTGERGVRTGGGETRKSPARRLRRAGLKSVNR